MKHMKSIFYYKKNLKHEKTMNEYFCESHFPFLDLQKQEYKLDNLQSC